MNYYLTRDGQTYGPYPEASFSALLQAGQVVANDLLRRFAYGFVAVCIAIGGIVWFVQTQKEKKAIAKLQSEPGWTSFNSAKSSDANRALPGGTL